MATIAETLANISKRDSNSNDSNVMFRLYKKTEEIAKILLINQKNSKTEFKELISILKKNANIESKKDKAKPKKETHTLSDLVPAMSKVLDALTVFITNWSNPIVVGVALGLGVVVALVPILLIVYLLIMNFIDNLPGLLNNVLTGLIDALGNIISKFTVVLVNTFKNVLRAIFGPNIDKVFDMIDNTLLALATTVTTILTTISNVITGIFKTFEGKTLGQILGGLISDMITGIVDGIIDGMTDLLQKLDSLMPLISKVLDELANTIANTIGGFLDNLGKHEPFITIVSVLKSMGTGIDKVSAGIYEMTGAIKSYFEAKGKEAIATAGTAVGKAGTSIGTGISDLVSYLKNDKKENPTEENDMPVRVINLSELTGDISLIPTKLDENGASINHSLGILASIANKNFNIIQDTNTQFHKTILDSMTNMLEYSKPKTTSVNDVGNRLDTALSNLLGHKNTVNDTTTSTKMLNTADVNKTMSENLIDSINSIKDISDNILQLLTKTFNEGVNTKTITESTLNGYTFPSR